MAKTMLISLLSFAADPQEKHRQYTLLHWCAQLSNTSAFGEWGSYLVSDPSSSLCCFEDLGLTSPYFACDQVSMTWD